MTEEHIAQIGQDFVGGKWEAGCSCGWEGNQHELKSTAMDEWENHCDVVFMESTMQ